MGNHRADRRGQTRVPSETPVPTRATSSGGKRKAVKSAAKPAERRAEKPAARRAETPAPRRSTKPAARRAAEPVTRRTEQPPATQRLEMPVALRADEPAPRRVEEPAPQREATPVARRAEKPAERRETKPPARRAEKPAARRTTKPVARRAASRGPLFRGLPSTPILVGIAALAVSAGGAVTAAVPSLVGSEDSLSQASALTGASDVSRVSLLESRDASVSRDSSRDALADSADDQLVAQAEAQAQQHNAALAKLAKQAETQAHKIALNQWVLPVDSYHLTARFGEYSGLWSHFHTGLDFAAPSGTPIHAVANGTVTSTGYDGAYGNKTVITLDDGTELWFCHQTSYVVSPGDEVRAGQLIGYVGSTGNVTGPHLHLEVRPGGGDPVDPYQALVVHGLQP